MQEKKKRGLTALAGKTTVVDTNAIYNLYDLELPKPNGPNGQRVLDMEMLMNHGFFWEWLNKRETEEVLMELYVIRTQKMQ